MAVSPPPFLMYVDSHCHLDFPELAADIDGILSEIQSLKSIRRSDIAAFASVQSGFGILYQGATKRVPFDVLKTFEPVVRLTQQPYVLLVHPSVPAKSIKELIAAAKALGLKASNPEDPEVVSSGFEHAARTAASEGTAIAPPAALPRNCRRDQRFSIGCLPAMRTPPRSRAQRRTERPFSADGGEYHRRTVPCKCHPCAPSTGSPFGPRH